MANELDISIVIGYKDWGLRRLIGAVRSLNGAACSSTIEVIVSDYGSTENEGYREAIEAAGAIYVRTETDGIWSRSRALNAGLAIASGRTLITTDADMVFSPGTLDVITDRMRNDSQQFIVMQCNDLPEGIDHEDIESGNYTWDELERLSTLRPRWGMGGLIAIPRDAYFSARGLDERMEIYGGEDIDFARRMRRLGLKLHWLAEDTARMYHVWHPSSRASANETAVGRRAIAINRDIQLNDRTAARNLKTWLGASQGRNPLVSVVISTHNRARYLRYAILSTLAQTLTDLELIIVDDGSTDETSEVVEAFADNRIRYFKREQSGLAAARNFATSVARGKYIAVMDDDDIMLTSRLEDSLNAITGGANGSYGGWIDFSDDTGERSFRTGKKLTSESIFFNSGTYLHPTLFIERRWMEAIPYDSSMRSGSDYNLATRLLRSGVRLNHSGKYLLMRRIHGGQITNLDPSIQKASGAISAFWGRASMLSGDVRNARADRNEKDKVPIEAQKTTEPRVVEYLPDHVVKRKAFIQGTTRMSLTDPLQSVLQRATSRRELQTARGELVQSDYYIDDVSLEELFLLRSAHELSVVIETEIASQPAALKMGEKVKLPASHSEIESTPDYINAMQWLVETSRADARDAFLILSGSSEALKAAEAEIGLDMTFFISGTGEDAAHFSVHAYPGELELNTVEVWRKLRGRELSMSIVSDLERK